MEKRFFSGLSGIQLPLRKFEFPEDYQETSRLTYYASLFNSIEVNSSFYKIPQERTVSRWVREVPGNFLFTFKLFKEITHCRDFKFEEQHISDFMKSIAAASEKKGCILVQFPPSLTSSFIEHLALLLDLVRRHNHASWKIAVEFRNKSWYLPSVYELLDSFGATLVIHDIPKSATPSRQVTSHTVYLRFHGPEGNYKGSYSNSFLSEYASYVGEWLSEGKTVFAYFNNTNGGDAYHNLVTFNKMVLDS